MPEDELLATHADLLRRMRLAYGGDEGDFEARLSPVIRRYAALVHLLPATPDSHFREEGGLLRCGLEVGFHALQAADAQIFPVARTVPERREMEPRWRTALFIAGLCAELHRGASAIVVTEHGEADWNPLVGPLTTWLVERGSPRYTVHWPASNDSMPALGLLFLPQVVSPPVLAFLADGDRSVLFQMAASLAAAPGQAAGVIGEIVQRTLGLVADRDLRRNASGVPPHQLSAPLDPDLVAPALARARDNPSDALGAPFSTAATQGDAEQPVVPAGPGADLSARTSGVQETTPQPLAATPHRELLLPPTLNPLVAEALRIVLNGDANSDGHESVEMTDEGIYVPLGAWQQHGLDTGMVVRSLHEAGLLLAHRGQKVRRRRINGSDVLGVLIIRGILV